MKNEIGENFRRLRKKNDFTQEEMAEKCNVSREALGKWERGETTPSLELVVKMAEIYGITVDELIFGTRENNPNNTLEALCEKVERLQESIISIIDLKSKNYTLYEQYCNFYSQEREYDIEDDDIPADVYAQMGEDAADKGNLIDAIKYFEEALIHGNIQAVDALMLLHNNVIDCYACDENSNQYRSYRLEVANKMQQYGKIVEDQIGRKLGM